MNNPGEGEDRETGEEMPHNKTEAAEGQTTEVRAIQGENGDHDAPQPEGEQARGESRGQTRRPQPEKDRETGDVIEEEAAEETQVQDRQEPQLELTCSCGKNSLYKPELRNVYTLSRDLWFVEMMSFIITLVSTMFYCKLESAKIESLSLGIAMFNITGVSVGIGLAQTFDTLISQTYGCGNMKRIGVMLQRAVLFACLFCFISWSILIYTEPIALFLNRTPQVASDAQLYAYIMIPAVPACFLYQLQAKFLQNQKIIFPQLITGYCVNMFNWAMNYALVYQLQYGLIGSAVSTAISHVLMALFLFIIITTRGLHKTTWPGWTQDCLQEWGSFSVTAFFSVAMLCAELWVFEAWVFIAGTINKVELAAQWIIYNMYIGVITIPMAIAEAASVCVGNALGTKDVGKADRSYWAAAFWSGIVAFPLGAFLYLLGHQFKIFYSQDEEVLERTTEAMLIFVVLCCLDVITRVIGGVIRGAGEVWKAGVCNIVCHAIGLALGLALSHSDKGIMGYGTGIFIGVTLQSTLYIFIMFNLQWPVAVKEAQARAGILKGDEINMIQRGPGASAAPINQPVPVRRVMVVGEVLPWNQLVQRCVLALCYVVVVLVTASVNRVSLMKALLDEENAAASPPPSTSPTSVLGE